jgi:hypothetical protein
VACAVQRMERARGKARGALQRIEADYSAGYEAYLLAEPTPANASQAWRNGWERALSDERGETVPS